MAKLEIEIYKGIKDYAGFICDVVCANLAQAMREEKIDVSEAELNKILSYVKLSVEQASVDGMRGIESLLKNAT